jgi:hypothetical protein
LAQFYLPFIVHGKKRTNYFKPKTINMANPKKTDESVKAGMEIAADTNPDSRPDESKEQDMNEIVHGQPSDLTVDEMEKEEEDIDDLVQERDGGEG